VSAQDVVYPARINTATHMSSLLTLFQIKLSLRQAGQESKTQRHASIIVLGGPRIRRPRRGLS
jgi:hypothetical protein